MFVLACSDDAAPRIDVGRPADAADWPRCESASGGCWIYKIGTPVDISQSPPAPWPIRWQCVIDNPGADRTDLRPVAFATCLDLTP